ncbi:MAG: DUF6597 domain-containing transcriptional factor [Puniceicoccaceae bacterium]
MMRRQPPKHRPIQPWVPQSEVPGRDAASLRYREFAPPPALESILVGIWTLIGSEQGQNTYFYHVVPDGCTDLVYDRGAGEGFIFGTVSASKTVVMPGDVSIVGIRLQPHVLQSVTGLPPSEVMNTEPSFTSASVGYLNDLFERYAFPKGQPFGKSQVEALAEAVASMHRPERINPRAQWLISALLEGNGSVDRASQTTGFCTRQLQRIARQDLGLAPKMFGCILRLQQTFHSILDTNKNQAHTAALHGYADQAHMIREFTRLTGYSPGFWRARKMSDSSNPTALKRA